MPQGGSKVARKSWWDIKKEAAWRYGGGEKARRWGGGDELGRQRRKS